MQILSPFFLFFPRREERIISSDVLSNLQREEGFCLESSELEEYLGMSLWLQRLQGHI